MSKLIREFAIVYQGPGKVDEPSLYRLRATIVALSVADGTLAVLPPLTRCNVMRLRIVTWNCATALHEKHE